MYELLPQAFGFFLLLGGVRQVFDKKDDGGWIFIIIGLGFLFFGKV